MRLIGRTLVASGLLLLTSVRGSSAQSGPHPVRGFHAAVFASGLENPTALAVGPDKRLYVAQQNGVIVAVGPGGRTTVASGYASALGLAWYRGRMYVSSTGTVSVLTPHGSYTSFTNRVAVSGLPTGRHQNDGMAFQKTWMYLGVGSTCNVCAERDPRSATIMRFHLDGSHAQVYARGLRNPFGLAFRPATGTLYATDNGRDDYDDQVPDELNRIVRGGNYGWPNCWGRGGGQCRGSIPPVALFEPHSSADGLVFYTGHSFSNRYFGDAFVAEWGDSVNALGTGQRVKDVHFSGGRVTVSDFVTSLAHPLAVAVAPDGALLVADWGTGLVWRIQADGR